MKKTVITLNILIMLSMSSFGQDNINQKDMDSVKAKIQSLCILKETDDEIIYLTELVRFVWEGGDKWKSYVSGDPFYFSYKIQSISTNRNFTSHESAMLAFFPKRIAIPDEENYDIYDIRISSAVSVFYENGNPIENAKGSRAWSPPINFNKEVYEKILQYFFNHKEKVPIMIETFIE